MEALRECPNCRLTVRSGLTTCPVCGYDILTSSSVPSAPRPGFEPTDARPNDSHPSMSDSPYLQVQKAAIPRDGRATPRDVRWKVHLAYATLACLLLGLGFEAVLSIGAGNLGYPLFGGPSPRELLGVPADFHQTYTIVADDDIGIGPRDRRRSVSIRVPLGLTDSALFDEMRAAAAEVYEHDGRPHVIRVFAFKPSSELDNGYTAGRLVWAPYGDWDQAKRDVPVSENKATVDVSPDYRQSLGERKL